MHDFSRQGAIDAFYRIPGTDSLHVVPLMVNFLACMRDEQLEETIYIQSDIPVTHQAFSDPEFHEYVGSLLVEAAAQRGVKVKDGARIVVFNSVLHPEEANMFKNKTNNT